MLYAVYDAAAARFIILNKQFLVFNTQLLVFNTKFIVLNTKFIVFNHLTPGLAALMTKPITLLAVRRPRWVQSAPPSSSTLRAAS